MGLKKLLRKLLNAKKLNEPARRLRFTVRQPGNNHGDDRGEVQEGAAKRLPAYYLPYFDLSRLLRPESDGNNRQGKINIL